MGSAQSAKHNRLFPQSHSARHHSSALPSQPLSQDQNQNLAIQGEKVDHLKKSLDEEIMRREADKRIYSAGFSNQGLALKRIEKKNIEVEKENIELKTRVDEMMCTMVELAAVVAELKHESPGPKEANELDKVRITDVAIIVSKEGLCIVLIFLIGVLIGLNL